MDLRKVKKLIELAEESDLAELEVSGSEESVRIVRNQISKSIVPSEISSQAIGSSLIQGDDEHSVHTISSPMAGTIYSATSPGADPFLVVGQAVAAGEVVCIIESMKMMHEIKAISAGEVLRVCARNGEAVGTADPLFELR